MKRLLALTLVLGIVAALLAPASANASIWGNALTFDGFPDTTVGTLLGHFDYEGGVLKEGDVFVGTYRVNQVTRSVGVGSTVPPSSLLAIYAFEVADITVNPYEISVPGEPTEYFNRVTVGTRAVSTGNALSIRNILETIGLSDSVTGTGLNQVAGAGDLSEAVMAIVEHVDPSLDTDLSMTGGLLSGGLFANTIGASTGWSLSMVLGLLDDDFQQIRMTLPGQGLWDGVNEELTFSPDEIASGAEYKGAHSVLEDVFGPGIVYIPGEATPFETGASSVEADFVTSGGNTFSVATNSNLDNGWHVQGAGNNNINPTPEPASAIVWLLLISVVALGGRRLRVR